MNKQYLKDAKAYAMSRGFSDIADDFAQEAAMAKFQGRKILFKTFLIDYMRANFGDTRRANDMKHHLEFYDVLPEVGIDPIIDGYVEWEALLDLVDETHRPMFVLHYHWDMTLKDIGYAMGVSEGRIHQKMNVELKKLRKRFKNQKVA